MTKLLIVGIDSLVGSNLALALADRCQVAGISQRRNFAVVNCQIVAGGMPSTSELAKIVADEQPKWIVYCGPSSVSSWDWCGEFEAGIEARRVTAIWQAAQQYGSQMTLVSSDAAVHGPRMFQREKSHASTHDATAIAVREIEKPLLGTNALVVRSHVFGWSPTAETWAERLWNAIEEARPVQTSGTRYATPIFAGDFAELLWQAQLKNLRGLYHLGGAERVNMWQFAVALAAAAGTTVKVLQTVGAPATVAPHVAAVRLVQETSLDSRQMQRQLKSPLPLLRDGLHRFLEQSAGENRNRVHPAIISPVELSAA